MGIFIIGAAAIFLNCAYVSADGKRDRVDFTLNESTGTASFYRVDTDETFEVKPVAFTPRKVVMGDTSRIGVVRTINRDTLKLEEGIIKANGTFEAVTTGSCKLAPKTKRKF